MILFYDNSCQQEFEIVKLLLKWQNIEFTIEKKSKIKNPTLIDAKDRVLGRGFFSIVKYLDGRNR